MVSIGKHVFVLLGCFDWCWKCCWVRLMMKLSLMTNVFSFCYAVLINGGRTALMRSIKDENEHNVVAMCCWKCFLSSINDGVELKNDFVWIIGESAALLGSIDDENQLRVVALCSVNRFWDLFFLVVFILQKILCVLCNCIEFLHVRLTSWCELRMT